MSSLEGKIVALTGGASGIGLATAQLLASQGAILSLADANEPGLEAALKSLAGKNHTITKVDVRDSKQVNSWIEKTLQDHGQLDAAVNLAGVARNQTPVKEETDESWNFIMDINAKGVFNCLRAQLNHMKTGSIVNAASVAGLAGFPGAGTYCASKWAVIALTKSAAKENANIRINAVAPGTVATPLVKNIEKIINGPMPTSQQVMDRKADPIEVAKVVVFLLSDDASFMTGAVVNVDGGWMP